MRLQRRTSVIKRKGVIPIKKRCKVSLSVKKESVDTKKKIIPPKNPINLSEYKKSDTCVLLGSGPSICNITPEEWEVIEKYDSCAVNNWVYHPTFVPKFYFIETKWYGYDIIRRRLQEKFEAYKDVVFLFPREKKIRNPREKGKGTQLLRDVAKGFKRRVEYNLVSRDRKRTHPIYTADYVIRPDRFTKSYDMSITCVFEFLLRMGYSRIILYGIDLLTSWYFWTGNDFKYGEVHHQWNKEHEDKDPILPHNTHKIKDFIIDFNERWMKPYHKEIVIGHIDTALYPRLRYVNILEEF